MPIPDAIWAQLLANIQASGQSFNPYGIGQAAAPASGMSIDEAIAEARQRLSGQWPPPSGPAQSAPSEEPLSMFGDGVGGTGPGPSSAALSVGSSYGYNPAAVQTGLSFLGANPFTPSPISLGLTAARAVNSIPAVQAFLAEAAPFGVVTPEGPTPAVISQTMRDTPGFPGALARALGTGGIPTGVSFLDEFGMPGNPFGLGANRVATETGITPGFSQGLSGGLGTSNVGAPGQTGGVAPSGQSASFNPDDIGPQGDPGAPGGAEAGAPGGGTGPGGGPGGTGASEGGAGTEAGHTGKRVSGKKGKEKTMRVLGGEQIMSNAATDAYGPILNEMEAKAGSGNIDDLMTKARAFWTV